MPLLSGWCPVCRSRTAMIELQRTIYEVCPGCPYTRTMSEKETPWR